MAQAEQILGSAIRRTIRNTADWAGALGEILAKGPADMDAWMDRNTTVLKSDPYSRVGLLTLGDELCYLKFYKSKSLLQKLSYRMGHGRAVRSFDSAVELVAAGVSVPQPRCCLRRPGGLVLLTQGLPEGEDLKTLWLSSPSPETWEQLLLSAGSAMAEFHRAGFSHGDCKWSNLVHSGGQFYLVDLEAVQGASKKSPRIARDLARFTVNAEDMGLSGEHYEHFLERYAEEVGSSRDALITQIMGPLEQLRSRHLSKYGSRGHRLI